MDIAVRTNNSCNAARWEVVIHYYEMEDNFKFAKKDL
jgi:hypothetical protein